MKKIILLVTTLLLTAQSFAAPGICYSCLGIGYAPDVPPTLITNNEELSQKLTNLPSKSLDLSVCFKTSICIAAVEGKLSGQAVGALLSTLTSATPGSASSSNYSEKFKEAMGIGETKLAKQIKDPRDITDITESGFVNFIDTSSSELVHTGYIYHDAIKGISYLYTINKLDLVSALNFSDGVRIGETPLINHQLTTEKAKDFTSWISGKYDVYFQPSSTVERNILAK